VREETDAWDPAGGERRGGACSLATERGRRARACLAAWWAALTGRGGRREGGVLGQAGGGLLFPLFFYISKAFSKWNLNQINSNQKANNTELNMLQHEMHQHVY